MTDIQGALGVAQMARARRSARRAPRARRVATTSYLAELEWLRTSRTFRRYVHGYQAYVCLFSPDEPTLANVDRLHDRRNELMLKLEERGVATRQGTHARDPRRLRRALWPSPRAVPERA